jgi:hypothetical protein
MTNDLTTHKKPVFLAYTIFFALVPALQVISLYRGIRLALQGIGDYPALWAIIIIDGLMAAAVTVFSILAGMKFSSGEFSAPAKARGAVTAFFSYQLLKVFWPLLVLPPDLITEAHSATLWSPILLLVVGAVAAYSFLHTYSTNWGAAVYPLAALEVLTSLILIYQGIMALVTRQTGPETWLGFLAAILLLPAAVGLYKFFAWGPVLSFAGLTVLTVIGILFTLSQGFLYLFIFVFVVLGIVVLSLPETRQAFREHGI